MHQGHLDLIMQAKKENDICYVIVCGYDNEPRGEEVGLPLRRRISLAKKMFRDDEQIRVLSVNDTELGIDESMCESNWDKWLGYVYNQILKDIVKNFNREGAKGREFTFYVAEKEYEESINKRSEKLEICKNCKLIDKKNPVSGTLIRQNPLKYWDKIAWAFRPHFSTNILITGTASEGKSTLTRDIATYFGIPYSEEYGRTYMEQMGKSDTDLTINDFQEFLMEQRRDTKGKIEGPGNKGIVISDTDNLVTLMYAQAYADDENIDLTWDDYKSLEALARNIQRGISWAKIFLLPPKNKFVDDGTRYMQQSSMEERQKNYTKLVKLLKRFGWWDKVEILDKDYLHNFERVRDYINFKMTWE